MEGKGEQEQDQSSIKTSPETKTRVTHDVPEGARDLVDITTVPFKNDISRLLHLTYGLEVSKDTKKIIESVPTPDAISTISPIALDYRAMGLSDVASISEVWEKAKQFGDRITAPQIATIAIEVARGHISGVEPEMPLIAIMDPIPDTKGNPSILMISRDHNYKLSLSHHKYDPDEKYWNHNAQFVVASPRKMTNV